ncbi:MAG: hypothetical protein A2W25_11795 [candidate division Zixibacteria bacterium RBG_16_53_22]|nr:MAG: hypothetical protein A2W25_11795 [candidate division Zixibacteria bacterium RBG_16_53_22]
MTKTCAREGCGNPLNKGKYYCSPSCSAQDRIHKRNGTSPIPADVKQTLTQALGSQDASFVLKEMESVMLQEEIITAPPIVVKTEGDFMYTYYMAGEDRRPSDALEGEIIREMLKSGIVLFVLEMKLASMMGVFRNDRSWKVVCPDKELAGVAEANLRQIMPRMMLDALRSMLTYGAYFGEKSFEYKNPYQLGLSKSRGASKEYAVPKLPAACNPESITYIKRTTDGSFDGFVQTPKNVFRARNEIDVERKAALVIPYRGQFRNLWGESYLKPIYPIWFWYEIALRSWVRYMERMGTPVAVCYAPSRAKVLKPGTTTAVDAMTWGLAVAGNIAKSNAAVLPSDVHPETKIPLWKLEYLVAQDRGEVFGKAIEMLSQLMIRAGMAADRAFTQGGETGSYALGQIHDAATQIHNELILIEVLWALNQWFMPDYVAYNRGENGPPMWLETEGLDPREKERLFKIMSIAGNAENFKEALFMVNWREMYEVNNVPTLTEKEVDELKEKMLQEGLTRQEETMKVQKKFAPKPGELPKREETPQQTAAKTEAATNANGDAKKFENLAYAMLNGSYVPIILSDHEMALVAGIRDPEVVKLYNPFHDKLGKFAARRGAGGSVIPQEGGTSPTAGLGGGARAKPGSFLKTTGLALGIAGLGAVVLAGLASATRIEYGEPGEVKDEDSADPPESAPVYDSLEDATQAAIGALNQLGIDTEGDISVSVGQVPGNNLGYYDPGKNAMVIREDLAQDLMNGSPAAMHALVHELAHSNQQTDDNMFWQDQEWAMDQGTENFDNFVQHLEGQNDAVTMAALSHMYGKPMDYATVVAMHAQYRRDNDLPVNIVRPGYPDQAAYWAGIAKANQSRTGESLTQFSSRSHDTGLSPDSQFDILWELFPERLGSYQKSKTWPSYQQIMIWLGEDYDVDTNQAFTDMLEEALQ